MSNERPADTIGGALLAATAELRSAGAASPRLDAELLLGHLSGKSRTRLAIDADESVSSAEIRALGRLVARRAAGEPIAYLIGHREFMGYDFLVGRGVLVPRPETELLVERAVVTIERMWPGGLVRVLDLCTGSGAIALSLKRELMAREDTGKFHYDRREDTEVLYYDRGEDTEVLNYDRGEDTEVLHYEREGDAGDVRGGRSVSITGSDISADALAFARKNREALGLDEVVDLVEGDLLSWTDGPWDVILTNPPYLRPDQIDGNSEIAAEPRLALDGGKNGIELIERILDQAVERVSQRFGMLIELDPDHADAVRALAAARFPTASVIIVADLTGRDRFLAIEREESEV